MATIYDKAYVNRAVAKGYSHAVVFAYSKNGRDLPKRYDVYSIHKSYDGALKSAANSGMNSFLAIKDLNGFR